MQKIEQAISSIEVAEMMEKNHYDLLRDVKKYVGYLGESKIAFTDFFNVDTYKDANPMSVG